jgi:hypothetical protein
MSYFGIPRGRNKAHSTIRLTIDNDSLTNNATLYTNSAAGVTVTFATSAWLELVSSLSQAVNFIEIFDSTGNTARLGTGAASSEVDLLLDTPGGNGHIPVYVAAGTRISLKPLTTPPAGAEVVINFWD